MNRSVLIRLLPTSRTGPRLAGTAEVIATGERLSFRDADDLVSLLNQVHADPADGPDPAGPDLVIARVEPPAAPHP